MIKKSEAIMKFEEALNSDESLRNKYEAAMKKIADEGTAENDGEIMAKAANELGFEIKVEEMERLYAEMQELDEEELDETAGGGDWVVCRDPSSWDYDHCPNNIQKAAENEDEKGHDGWCMAAWHCFAAAAHTDAQSDKVSCWKNHLCRFINK